VRMAAPRTTWTDPATDGEARQPDGHHEGKSGGVEGRISVLPWEISSSPRAAGAGGRRRCPTNEEKSAEVIVVRITERRAEFENQGAA
jgi:hypothetical protein